MFHRKWKAKRTVRLSFCFVFIIAAHAHAFPVLQNGSIEFESLRGLRGASIEFDRLRGLRNGSIEFDSLRGLRGASIEFDRLRGLRNGSIEFEPLRGIRNATIEFGIAPNTPPECDPNGPYAAECSGSTTTVQLDGGASSDPDDDPLTFAWSTDCPGGIFDDPAGETPVLTVDTSPGCQVNCTVSLTVTDDDEESDVCDTTVAIADTAAPTVTCPADATGLECPADTSVAANGSASGSDTCGSVTIGSSDVSVAGCGLTETITRTWTATDDCSNSASCDQTVATVDTTGPTITLDTTPIEVTDLDCSGDEAVTLPVGTANDECEGTLAVTDDAPATFPAGATTPVTFTAADTCQNSSSATVDVTVLFGADILVTASKHTVGSGSHPGSTKEPLVGIEVCAYDKSDGSCARTVCGGISHQHYECIATTCDSVNCCTTGDAGTCTINLPPGDYVVISLDATKTVLPDPLGVSASDLVFGELKRKHLQQIVKADGKTVPGKTTRRTGSELLIIEPEYVLWDSTEQLYPFVFESVGDWGVNAAVAPPEGFVADYGDLSVEVNGVIESVQFTVTEIGSDLVPTGTTFTVTHRGRREIIHSNVGIFLTPEYARSRGFNVARLRAQGLIRERPGNQGQGDDHRR